MNHTPGAPAGPVDRALAYLRSLLGSRVCEACGINIEALFTGRCSRTLTLLGKHSQLAGITLPPHVAHAINGAATPGGRATHPHPTAAARAHRTRALGCHDVICSG